MEILGIFQALKFKQLPFQVFFRTTAGEFAGGLQGIKLLLLSFIKGAFK